MFSQELQFRLQEKVKQVDNLTAEIQSEKVVSFFYFPPPFSTFQSCRTTDSPKFRFVLADNDFLRDQMVGLLIELDRQVPIPK